jgi:hypothetical protein
LQLGQIDEMQASLGTRQADFLVISIGGNDCGWIQGFVDIITTGDHADEADVEERVGRFIDLHLETNLIALNERISNMTPQPRFVLLTLYPLGFFGAGTASNPTTNRNCGIFDAIDLNPLSEADSQAGIDDNEAAIIKSLARRLNAMLSEFVVNQNKRNLLINQISSRQKRQFEWHVVNHIDKDFEIHGYCAPDTWFVSASNSYLHQGDWGGILHPNSEGQAAYARRIHDVMHSLIERNLDSFRPRETPVPPDIIIGPDLGLDPQFS